MVCSPVETNTYKKMDPSLIEDKFVLAKKTRKDTSVDILGTTNADNDPLMLVIPLFFSRGLTIQKGRVTRSFMKVYSLKTAQEKI